MDTQQLYILLHEGKYACLLRDEDASPDIALGIAPACEGDWGSLKPFERFLDTLRELEAALPAHESRQVCLVYEPGTAQHLAELMQRGSGIYARHWRMLDLDDVFGTSDVFAYPHPPLDSVQAALASWITQQSSAQATKLPPSKVASAHAAPISSPAVSQPVPLRMPTAEQLLSYLPALYHQAFTILSGADLAILIGEVSPLRIPSPYPELSADALAMKQRAFMALPPEQQRQIVAFAQSASKRLRPRVEMQVYIRGVGG